MKKKLLITCMSAMCCLTLAACGSKTGNQGKDPLTGQEMSSSADNQESMSSTQADEGQAGNGNVSFESMLGEEGNSTGIIDYINTNIANASDMDVRRFLGGLLGYGNDIREIDFTGLEQSRQYMPEDMIAFMDLMRLEADSPSMVMSNDENRRVIGLTLSEMLERALLFEHHLEKYPNEVSSDAAQKLYEEIATNAITGGYDKGAGVEHYYKGETSDVVDKDSLEFYEQFAKANPESNLGKIVKDYIEVLNKSSFRINEDMESFYHGLYQRLQISETNSQTDINGTTNNNSGTDMNNNTGTAGTNSRTGNSGTNGTVSGNGINNTGASGNSSRTGNSGINGNGSGF